MLEVRDLTVRLGGRVVLDGVDLTVGSGQTLAVLGPSGCGKSTMLRAIAGLERPERGRICWEGRDLAGMPPHERRFGLMFQDYALFPHRDVRGNVEFGLRMAGMATPERRRRVDDVLALVGLGGLADRRVTNLSGGEQQRVALARALAPEPRLLMLDEPLGSLDRSLRERLVDELRELLALAAVPAIYVTHDHDEAFALADRLVVMREGRVAHEGAPRDVWQRPADEWVARFLGFPEGVDATVESASIATPWGLLPRPHDCPSGPARVVLRPGAVRAAADGPLPAKVEHVTFRGQVSVARVRMGSGPVVELPVDPAVSSGETLRVAVDVDGVLIYAEA